MSNPPKSLLKSRENLQELFKNPNTIIKYEKFDKVLSLIWADIRPSPLNALNAVNALNTLKPLKSPKYIINLHDPRYFDREFHFTEKTALELIEILKKEYPGVDFTYKETAGYDGRIIERIIIMDWSV
jgi:hypothetical protein